jgi:hypothetical protein
MLPIRAYCRPMACRGVAPDNGQFIHALFGSRFQRAGRRQCDAFSRWVISACSLFQDCTPNSVCASKEKEKCKEMLRSQQAVAQNKDVAYIMR